MANYIIVAVKDLAAQTFGRPFYVPHENAAIRSFTQEVNTQPEQGSIGDMYNHPDDFELYSIGVFDDRSGKIIPSDPVLLVQAKHVSTRAKGNSTPIVHLNGGSDVQKSVVL